MRLESRSFRNLSPEFEKLRFDGVYKSAGNTSQLYIFHLSFKGLILYSSPSRDILSIA